MAKKATAKKTKATDGGTKDAKAFVEHVHKDKKIRSMLRKPWDEVIQMGKKQGYKFTRQELRDHLMRKYNLTASQEGDEPDTCICIA
jgi:predicted ribosomally synthesized peptide with nif11-like leader